MELDGFKDLEQQRQAREDFFEKAFDPTYIEKGKRGGTGEIRQWKDGKYQKQGDGTWKPVKDGGGKNTKDKPVGSIHEHNGKKYKKQANGKWLEVSEQGMTKEEHRNKSREINREIDGLSSYRRGGFSTYADAHKTAASKLSDKEYTYEEVGLRESVNEAKGKSGDKLPVGSTHEHNGKKYKKQSNGKWLEVSESHSKTWKEHERIADKIIDEGRKTTHKPKEVESFEKEADTHYEYVYNLSDKEHTDEEVGLGSKKEEPKNSEESPYSEEKKKLFEEVREWSGDFPDEVINSVYDQIYGKKGAAGFTVSRSNSSTVMSEKVNQKVKELMDYTIDKRTLEGNPSKSDIQDIVWGLLMSKNS